MFSIRAFATSDRWRTPQWAFPALVARPLTKCRPGLPEKGRSCAPNQWSRGGSGFHGPLPTCPDVGLIRPARNSPREFSAQWGWPPGNSLGETSGHQGNRDVKDFIRPNGGIKTAPGALSDRDSSADRGKADVPALSFFGMAAGRRRFLQHVLGSWNWQGQGPGSSLLRRTTFLPAVLMVLAGLAFFQVHSVFGEDDESKAPSNLTARFANYEVVLSWDAPAGASHPRSDHACEVPGIAKRPEKEKHRRQAS